MKSLGTSAVCLAACAFLLGACGPEGEEVITPPVSTAVEKPKAAVPTTDPTAAEIASPDRVTAQTLVEDLGTRLGSPVTTYSQIATASNQWSVSCNGGSSRDIAYIWKVPETGSYRFSTSGSNFDTVLQIRNYRSTSEIMGCNDDYGDVLTSRITLSGLIRGAVLLIIIEGYDGDYGNFARLNIIKNP